LSAKFYVATLAAALERAAKLAPTKGVAFDKAAGIVVDIDPESESVALRATNLEIYYREEVKDVASYGDEKVSWRFPAHLLNGIVSGLPLDKEVTFRQEDDRLIHISCGKKKAKLRLLPSDLYPVWDRVTDENLKPAPGFAARIAQVAWAVDAQTVPFAGINLDGTHLNATDKYQAARVPCEVPLDGPVTVPLAVLTPVLKGLPGEITMAATEESLLLTVGDEIEVICSLYAAAYPDLGAALRKDFAYVVEVERETLRDAIASMLVLVKNERYPRMSFDFDGDVVALFMGVQETGDMSDEVPITYVGDAPSGTFSIKFTPEYLLNALDGAKSKKVTWSFGPESSQMVRVEDSEQEYVAYLQPLHDVAS
jgi:DNA polymerase III sliding clamp (beta) subunit (PCNA family)